jgi:hypothetical protein
MECSPRNSERLTAEESGRCEGGCVGPGKAAASPGTIAGWPAAIAEKEAGWACAVAAVAQPISWRLSSLGQGGADCFSAEGTSRPPVLKPRGNEEISACLRLLGALALSLPMSGRVLVPATILTAH